MSYSENEKLKTYYKKRNLELSPEPSGNNNKPNGNTIFVIQKHHASSLHYDFRLEMEGVLKSWAVPKGPSTNPSDKRLAVPTEDHPLDYGNFEGIIPEGNYGAGEVIIWDQGTYKNITKNKNDEIVELDKAFKSGRIVVWLRGKKLQGGYAFIRMGDTEKAKWLLIKMNDEKADVHKDPVNTEPESVISGQTIEDFKKERNAK